MGRAASTWIAADPRVELVSSLGRGEDWGELAHAEVILDLTRAGCGAEHGHRILEMGRRPVIGTSGVSAAEVAELDRDARERGLGGAVVPNFSRAMLLLKRAAAELSAFTGQLSLTEAHRSGKADAPSATAIELASQIGLSERQVVSIRADGVTAIHELRLSGGPDSLLIRHESNGLDSFRDGLLASLCHASGAAGVSHGLESILGGACKLGSEA